MDNMDQSPHSSQPEIEDSFDEEVTFVPIEGAEIGGGGDEAQLDISVVSVESTNIVERMEIDDGDSFGDTSQEWDFDMATPKYDTSPAHNSSFSDSSTVVPNNEDPEYEFKWSMVSILQNVVKHSKFCFSDIDTVVKCFTESSKEVCDSLKGILTVGISKLFHDEHANPLSISAVCRFTAIVAMRAYQEDQNIAAFSAVQEVVDIFMERPEAYCRIRSCEFITWMLTTATDSNEFMDGVEENKLPSVPVLQWCVHLCNKRVDKEVGVRCAAVKAIARLHLERFFDHKGRQATPFSLICSSLNDISPDVRKTAIHLLPLSSREAVDMAIRFLGYQDELPALRLQMAERIIRDVHLKSFTDRQKMAFLSQLYYDNDEDIKSLLGTKVVGAWLRALAHDDLDPMEEEEHTVLPAYPITLLKHLNCVKHEKIVVVIIKLAFSHYMNAAVGSRTDVLAHLEFLRKMTKAVRESAGVLHKTTVAKEIKADRSDLPQRIFMHRCLVEFLAGLCTDSPANKEIIVTRLLPNALQLSQLFQDYATKIFSGDRNINQQFVFYQILHLLHLTDLDCPVGKKAFEEALKIVIAGETFRAPLHVVEYAMDEVWDYVVKADEFDKGEFIDWAGYAVGRLLDSVGSLQLPTQADMRTYNDEEANRIHHAATIVQCILRNPKVTSFSPLMRSAFERIAIPLKHCVTNEGRILMARLIGLTALLDTTGSIVKNHVHTLRNSLVNDFMEVKVVTFKALVDISWKYGWGVVSSCAFLENHDKLECRADLAGLLEQMVCYSPATKFLPSVVFDSCRLLHKFIWPMLMGAIFYRIFDVSADGEADHTARVFLTGFAEKGIGAKIELIAGFFACCDYVEEHASDLRRFRFGALMSFICDLINRKLKKEPEKKLKRKTPSLDTVFAVNLLKRIATDPYGTVQPHLACVCLQAINISKIVKEDAHQVLQTASAVQTKLAGDDALARMKSAVSKFTKALEKQTGMSKNQPLRKTPRRYVSVKLEEQDLDDTDTEEQYTVNAKRRRLSRVSGSDASWSRSNESVKEEIFSQRVKTETVDEYWQEPEVIIIDSDHEDDDVTIVAFKTPRSRNRRMRKVPVLDDA